MKITAAASAALLATALFGCTQHQSTAPAAAAPATPASSVNTFGDKTDAADQVARARAEAFGNDNAQSSDGTAPNQPAAPAAASPK